jgi:hypothetical protein
MSLYCNHATIFCTGRHNSFSQQGPEVELSLLHEPQKCWMIKINFKKTFHPTILSVESKKLHQTLCLLNGQCASIQIMITLLRHKVMFLQNQTLPKLSCYAKICLRKFLLNFIIAVGSYQGRKGVVIVLGHPVLCGQHKKSLVKPLTRGTTVICDENFCFDSS